MPAIGASFADDRISMTHWYPRIAELDGVRVPETYLFQLGDPDAPMAIGGDVDGLMELLNSIPTEEIAAAVDDLPTEHAHIRGDYKASRLAGGEGRVINTNPKTIDEEILQLLDSHFMMGLPLRALAVRELVDVEVLAESYTGKICPEIRFIVDEGEVIDWFVDVYEDDFASSFDAAEVESILSDIQHRAEDDERHLQEMAQTVATELDDTGWSIDFIQSEDGEWMLTDMALYGLWWHEEESRWKNISHIPAEKTYNLETNPSEQVPPEPTAEMVRTARNEL